jgi:squalene-hopene/tetraprenyl-beta-curcumene cyclase
MKLALLLACTLLATGVAAQRPAGTLAPATPARWDAPGAAAYLDARMDAWFANGTKLKTGDTQTACVSCHAGLAYALARPALRRVLGTNELPSQEAKLIDETTRRVETSATHQVLYDFNERRQTESRGTEAVLNALILSSEDAARKLSQPSAITEKALARLWEVQRPDGRWDWLEFGLEPWETTEAAYHGATFAAFAVGTAPGNRTGAVATAGIERLRRYLSTNYPAQHLYNRTWALLASTRLEGIVTRGQREALIADLFRAQREDGGWSLGAIGPWKWSKTAPPVKSPGDLDASLLERSDGYATGLVAYTLQLAGVAADHAGLRKGLRWLETNQRPVPVGDVPGRAWQAHSLNYDREHGGEKGEPWRRLFMSDTATAFAVLALAEAN